MSDHTHIEWTDATWNPITGCSVVSAGCKHCYAMKLAGTRLQHHPSRAGLTIETKAGPVWNGLVRLNPEWLIQPIRWQRPRRIFVCAHGDLFHESVPDGWIDAVFGVMWACLYNRREQPGHVFQVLTKRPERMRAYLSTDRRAVWAEYAVAYGGGLDPDGLYDQTRHFDGPHPRIWLGVSVEDQAAADERIPLLLETPAAVRWISAEPLLGPVNFRWTPYAHQADGETYNEQLARLGSINQYQALRRLDWVVVGGESGPGARPMHPLWASMLRDQCAAADVAFLFKQWGDWAPVCSMPNDVIDGCYVPAPEHDPDRTRHCKVQHCVLQSDGSRFFGVTDPGAFLQGTHAMQMFAVGKRRAGRLLDGVLHDDYPVAGYAPAEEPH
jgi:protein gp37